MEKYKKLASLLTILVFIDCTATIAWVASGLAYEVNPAMSFLISKSYLLFAVVKLIGSFLSILLIYYFRTKLKFLVSRAFTGINIIYFLVCVYHLMAFLFCVFYFKTIY